jgi:hypothetical protein
MIHADAKPLDRSVLIASGQPAAARMPTAVTRQSVAGRTEVPAADVIDLAHLTRMTLGEKGLASEVLALFDRQAGMLLARTKRASPKAAAAFAHTLAGSARGVGAWKVAAAAEGLELAAKDCDPVGVAVSLRALAGAVAEARVAIRKRLAAQ